MSHSQDWDVNKYRSPHEPRHHWELKKKFMEHHKDRFPEKELVSTEFSIVSQYLTSFSLPGGSGPNIWQYRIPGVPISSGNHGAHK